MKIHMAWGWQHFQPSQVDWRDTHPSHRATALLYAAAAGHAVRAQETRSPLSLFDLWDTMEM